MAKRGTKSSRGNGGGVKKTKRGTSDVDISIGQRIRAKRMEINMSQVELGAALDVSFQQIQKYEKGTNRVATAQLIEISKALGVNTEYFITGMTTNGKKAPSGFEAFMSTREGAAIIEAMIELDQKNQGIVIDLARSLAK